MKIIHKLEMEMTQRGSVERIDVVQGDCNTRALELSLLSNGEVWTVPEDAVVWMRYCKSDGTKGLYDTLPDGSASWSIAENTVTVELAPQMLTVAGVVIAQVVLVQGAAELAAFGFQIHVERNPAAEAVTSEDYVNMLQWMEAELDRLLLEAKESGEFDGPQGAEGPQGPQGEPGGTVYEYATENGYAGTEEEFQEMLMTPCLPLAGGTMEGAVDMNSQPLSGLATPTADTHAANKAYVDKVTRTSTITVKSSVWSSAAPYTANVALSGVTVADWVHIQPAYSGTLAYDLITKAAFACIDHAYSNNNYITLVCLESKPDTDLMVTVFMAR